MQTITNRDGSVVKYTTNSGMEIIIKSVGCTNTDTDKYTIFLPSFAGCKEKCKFCVITMRNSNKQCVPATLYNLLSDIEYALEDFSKNHPSMQDRYLKISWMGTGDPFNNLRNVFDITNNMLYLNQYFKGIDGIDLATILPKTYQFDAIDNLVKFIDKFGTSNPIRNPVNRNRYIRVFLSLHSVVQETRSKLLPNAISLEDTMRILKSKYDISNRWSLIFHHMFLDGLNDTEKEIKELVKFMVKWEGYELRVLRYNSPIVQIGEIIRESPKFDEIIEELKSFDINIKIAQSHGKEINAACGQII